MASLTPEQARECTAALMADGRERTANDVAMCVGMPVNQAIAALRALLGSGLVTKEEITTGSERIGVYRRAEDGAR